jgi:VanZ family protein
MTQTTGRADRAARICLVTAFWVPLAACTYLALTPSPPSPMFRVSDIVLHALAFSYLTFSLGLAYRGIGRPMLVVWMLAYGAFIEGVQSFETARSAEVKDLLVDVAGIIVGLGALQILGDWSRRTLRTLLGYSFGASSGE